MSRVAVVHTLIFAKAPLPGLAKTRLMPALGAVGAAALAQRLLDHAVNEALTADLGPVELCVTPDSQDPFWDRYHDRVLISQQCSGDLGQRMETAANRVLARGWPVLLTGTDCPALNHTQLRHAGQALSRHDCTLLPVSDGGYALLGLNRPLPSLFSAMPWSTDAVARLTRQRIAQAGLSLWQGPELWDVDRPDDLARLAEQAPWLLAHGEEVPQ